MSNIALASNDVICIEKSNHKGNKLYRQCISKNVDSYMSASSNNEKRKAVNRTIEAFGKESGGGRFLKRRKAEDGGSSWCIVSAENVVNKTQQAFRDKGKIRPSKKKKPPSGDVRCSPKVLPDEHPCVLKENDVLCNDRSMKALDHPGNKLYQTCIEHNAAKYRLAHHKQHAAQQIVDAFRQENGGRFLEKKDDKLYEIGDEKATSKIQQAFRDQQKKLKSRPIGYLNTQKVAAQDFEPSMTTTGKKSGSYNSKQDSGLIFAAPVAAAAARLSSRTTERMGDSFVDDSFDQRIRGIWPVHDADTTSLCGSPITAVDRNIQALQRHSARSASPVGEAENKSVHEHLAQVKAYHHQGSQVYQDLTCKDVECEQKIMEVEENKDPSAQLPAVVFFPQQTGDSLFGRRTEYENSQLLGMMIEDAAKHTQEQGRPDEAGVVRWPQDEASIGTSLSITSHTTCSSRERSFKYGGSLFNISTTNQE